MRHLSDQDFTARMQKKAYRVEDGASGLVSRILGLGRVHGFRFCAGASIKCFRI